MTVPAALITGVALHKLFSIVSRISFSVFANLAFLTALAMLISNVVSYYYDARVVTYLLSFLTSIMLYYLLFLKAYVNFELDSARCNFFIATCGIGSLMKCTTLLLEVTCLILNQCPIFVTSLAHFFSQLWQTLVFLSFIIVFRINWFDSITLLLFRLYVNFATISIVIGSSINLQLTDTAAYLASLVWALELLYFIRSTRRSTSLDTQLGMERVAKLNQGRNSKVEPITELKVGENLHALFSFENIAIEASRDAGDI